MKHLLAACWIPRMILAFADNSYEAGSRLSHSTNKEMQILIAKLLAKGQS